MREEVTEREEGEGEGDDEDDESEVENGDGDGVRLSNMDGFFFAEISNSRDRMSPNCGFFSIVVHMFSASSYEEART